MSRYLERLIEVNDSQSNIVRMNFFDYIFLLCEDNIPFVVCNVTNEEFIEMQKQVSENKLYELQPRLENKGKYNQFRYMMSFEHDAKEFVIKDYNEEEIGYYVFTDEGLEYINTGEILHISKNSNVRKIYTTRTYKEVINYYKILKKVKDASLARTISEIDKQVTSLKQDKYSLLGKEYDLLHPEQYEEGYGRVLKKQ